MKGVVDVVRQEVGDGFEGLMSFKHRLQILQTQWWQSIILSLVFWMYVGTWTSLTLVWTTRQVEGVYVCVCVCTGGEWGSQQRGPMRHRGQFHCWQLFTLKLSFFLWLLLQRHHSWSNLGGAQVWKYTVILVCLQHKMIWSFFDVAVIVNYHQSV